MKPLGRFEWERRVLGPSGPTSPTTRFVLLTIATFLRRKDSIECWPSLTALQAATRLSGRAVIDQIKTAVAGGWITKRIGRCGDMARPGGVYRITLPTTERASPVADPSTTEPGSRVADATTSERPSPVQRATSEADDAGLVNVTTPTSEPLVNVVPSSIYKEVGFELEGNNKDFEVDGRDHVLRQEPEPKTDRENASLQSETFGDLLTWAEGVGLARLAGESEIRFRQRASAEWARAQAQAGRR